MMYMLGYNKKHYLPVLRPNFAYNVWVTEAASIKHTTIQYQSVYHLSKSLIVQSLALDFNEETQWKVDLRQQVLTHLSVMCISVSSIRQAQALITYIRLGWLCNDICASLQYNSINYPCKDLTLLNMYWFDGCSSSVLQYQCANYHCKKFYRAWLSISMRKTNGKLTKSNKYLCTQSNAHQHLFTQIGSSFDYIY